MTGKWVDNEVYFGPNRRRRGASKRWGERRHFDDAGEPPPLGAVLRRLRVLLMDMRGPQDRQRAIQLASLATTEAETLHLMECADLIKSAAQLVLANDIAGADAHIVEAQSLASTGPMHVTFR